MRLHLLASLLVVSSAIAVSPATALAASPSGSAYATGMSSGARIGTKTSMGSSSVTVTKLSSLPDRSISSTASFDATKGDRFSQAGKTFTQKGDVRLLNKIGIHVYRGKETTGENGEKRTTTGLRIGNKGFRLKSSWKLATKNGEASGEQSMNGRRLESTMKWREQSGSHVSGGSEKIEANGASQRTDFAQDLATKDREEKNVRTTHNGIETSTFSVTKADGRVSKSTMTTGPNGAFSTSSSFRTAQGDIERSFSSVAPDNVRHSLRESITRANGKSEVLAVPTR